MRVADELVSVAVAGDDHGVDPLPRCLLGEGGDDVVGFDPFDLERGDRERFEHLVDQRQLRGEHVRRLLTARLVLGVHLVPERRRSGVEGDGDVLGLLVPEHLDQHRREAVDGVRDRPGAGREVRREGIKRPVGQGMAIKEEKLVFVLHISGLFEEPDFT